jgi:hypothetical protein
VPGIDEKDMDVSIENNTLTVRGKRSFEKEEKEENFQRVERMYGSFTRSFTLPNTIDPDQVSAIYDKGVLKVRLAKRAEAKPKQIKVNVETTTETKGSGRARPDRSGFAHGVIASGFGKTDVSIATFPSHSHRIVVDASIGLMM